MERNYLLQKKINMKIISLFVFYAVFIINCFSQSVSITESGLPTSDTTSAILEIQSSSKGFLVPRMTTNQREAISSPVNGLIIFNTDSLNFWYYNGSDWVPLCTCDTLSCIDKKSNIYNGIQKIDNFMQRNDDRVEGALLLSDTDDYYIRRNKYV